MDIENFQIEIFQTRKTKIFKLANFQTRNFQIENVQHQNFQNQLFQNRNSKKNIIFRKFQLFQLWTNTYPSSDGVGRKTEYLSLRTRRVLSRKHVFRTNGEVLKTAN